MGSRKTFIPFDVVKPNKNFFIDKSFSHAFNMQKTLERQLATAQRLSRTSSRLPCLRVGSFKKREAGIVVGHQTQAGKDELQDGMGEGANATQRLPRLID
jgi:hypothetical protein